MSDDTCSDESCRQPLLTRGLCAFHYGIFYRSDEFFRAHDPRPPITDVDADARTCTCPVHGAGVRLRVRQRRGRVSYSCRACDRGSGPRHGANRDRAGENRREYRLRWRYGLTSEQVDLMVESQQGRCLICRSPLEDMAIDHCHTKGHVRGILCRACNFGLGWFRDDPKRLERAAKYLRRYRDDPSAA